MKKIVTILAISIALISCKKEEPIQPCDQKKELIKCMGCPKNRNMINDDIKSIKQ